MNKFYQIQEFDGNGNWSFFQNFSLDKLEEAKKELNWWKSCMDSVSDYTKYRLMLVTEEEIA